MFLSTPCIYISQLSLSLSLSQSQRTQTDRQSSEKALPIHHLSTLLKRSKVVEGEEGRKTQRERTQEGGGEKRGRDSRSTSPIAASVAHEHLSLSTVAERQAGRPHTH